MATETQNNARAIPGTASTTSFGLVGEVVILHAAWREYRLLRRLDADALRDMGLTDKDRSSVTVAGIAARMRG